MSRDRAQRLRPRGCAHLLNCTVSSFLSTCLPAHATTRKHHGQARREDPDRNGHTKRLRASVDPRKPSKSPPQGSRRQTRGRCPPARRLLRPARLLGGRVVRILGTDQQLCAPHLRRPRPRRRLLRVVDVQQVCDGFEISVTLRLAHSLTRSLALRAALCSFASDADVFLDSPRSDADSAKLYKFE